MKARTFWSVLAAMLVATACKKTDDAARVAVNYRQVANFSAYRRAPDGSSFGAGEGIYVMYKVTTIANTSSQAKKFTFDAHDVVTVTPDKTSNETINDGPTLLANQNLATVTVAAGQTKTVNKCFIKQVLTPNWQSLSSMSGHVPTLYQINQNQPVTMNDLAPSGANIVLVSNALPSSLQNECANH
jgi:hypothetical protein